MTQHFLQTQRNLHTRIHLTDSFTSRTEGFSLWSLNRSWRTFPGARLANDRGLRFFSALGQPAVNGNG